MLRTGLQTLLTEKTNLVAGMRVGLVSHAAAVLPDLTGILPALLAAGVRVEALFGPEHGFAGAAADGAAVGHARDRRTGLPVYSLYGETKEPDAGMLDGLDLLLVDFQDVGVRFYTYLSTLYYVLRGAGRHDLPVLLLDRPNPITGRVVAGPLVDPGYESFVGILPIPLRHGLTLGELARYMNSEYSLNARLTVVPVSGWQRSMWFDQTGLPWVPPSPAMPHLSTAILYPGMCFIEGTNLSEGRGTALPFEVVGAPWLDGEDLAARLERLKLPGAGFRPHTFTPLASKHANQQCQGVQVHVFDREALRPIPLGLHVLAACMQAAPDRFEFLSSSWEGHPPHMDLLAGSAAVRTHLLAGQPVDELEAGWAAGVAHFQRASQPYRLYD
jgi:uncharacterized protein YbbC (DUF1343 family)